MYRIVQILKAIEELPMSDMTHTETIICLSTQH